jgi:ABC-type branched-subunit amino acid transport system substrate-binding protein
MFQLARLDPDLASVRWYAGDGVTQSQGILDDAAAAQFATTVQLTAPNVGLDDALRSRWEPIRDEITATVGFTPDTFALSVYDAAWVAALSAVEVQFRREHLRDSFVRNVQRYWGITGPTALDAFGDRRLASFDFWTVRETDGQRSWIRTSQFAGGRVVR